tara:strand:- start:74 stop:943 length:870 start_codon:yes stop_codon:yes gene_type:complete
MITPKTQKEFKLAWETDSNIQFKSPVYGGDINQAFQVEIDGELFFVKSNIKNAFPKMFQKEAAGLEELKKSEFKVPEVIRVLETELNQFLVLEWIETGDKSPNSNWIDAGMKLAKMHQLTNAFFGFDDWNYMGSIQQKNNQQSTWSEFFATQRIEPMYEKARSSGYFSASTTKQLIRLLDKAESLFPTEPPSLVHGDLWSGNFLFDNTGDGVLIDPAVYYGHREMDIALSKLFGGFTADFYDGYNAQYPLEKGWEERVPLGQLYPLLLHVALFGNSYVGQVEQILNRFS